MLQTVRPHLNKFLLVLIFVGMTASTVLWTVRDKTPPAWDPADHISQGYDYYRRIANLELGGLTSDFFVEPHYYAPLVHLITALIFVPFGASRVAGIGVNFISLAALMISLSWLARRLYSTASSTGKESSASGRSESLLAAPFLAPILAASYHFPAWLLHDGFLDYPLMAITTVSFALLVRADDFSNRRDAILFGISAGLGMLVKQTFGFFLFLPFVYVAIKTITARKGSSILNFALASFVAVAVAAIWYAPHLEEVIEIYQANRQAAISENEAPLFSLMSNMTYVHGLLSLQIQVPLALLFLTGTVYSLFKCRRECLLVYLWLLSGIGFFTFIANKDLRYTVPVLPAVALLSVCWLRDSGKDNEQKNKSMFQRVLKPALVVAIVVWCGASFINAQWPVSGSGWFIDTPRFRWMMYARHYYGFDHRPLTDDWSLPRIVEVVAAAGPRQSMTSSPDSLDPRPSAQATATLSPPTQREGNESKQPVLGVVVNLPHINPSSLALNARLMASSSAGPPLIGVEWVVEEFALDRIERCDYLLVRSGLDQPGWVAPMERRMESLIRENPDRFELFASFPLPLEKTDALVYRLRR